jgi:hypothetical protein
MIIEKYWARPYKLVDNWHWIYRGWFLFGIIPLYIKREGCFHKTYSLGY